MNVGAILAASTAHRDARREHREHHERAAHDHYAAEDARRAHEHSRARQSTATEGVGGGDHAG